MTATTNVETDGLREPDRDPLAPQPTADTAAGPMRRLRILFGTDTYPPDVNGAANHTERLAAGLAARGHDVHVLCPSEDRYNSARVRDRVTEHRSASWRTPLHPTFRVCAPYGLDRVATSAIRSIQPDVVHVQGHFLIGRALTRAAKRQRIPLVATNHFMPDNLLGYTPLPARLANIVTRLAWRDCTRVLGRADAITAPTATAVRLLHAHGLSQRAQAVSCGINLATFRPRDHPTPTQFGLPDVPTIGFVGRLDAEKHLGDLIGALPLIRRQVDAQVAIAGVGTKQAALETLAITLGVGDHVHFLGFIPDWQLPDFYAALDVFAMPGTAELQSLATLEALASGTPVVAADAVALPHLVHPDVNGYLYPPGETATLAGRMVKLLTDAKLRAAMGRAARTIAEGHDVSATLDQYETIYRRVSLPAAGQHATAP